MPRAITECSVDPPPPPPSPAAPDADAPSDGSANDDDDDSWTMPDRNWDCMALACARIYRSAWRCSTAFTTELGTMLAAAAASCILCARVDSRYTGVRRRSLVCEENCGLGTVAT